MKPCHERSAIVAKDQMRNGVFEAREVRTEHDENHIPPEVATALQRGANVNPRAGSTAAQETPP